MSLESMFGGSKGGNNGALNSTYRESVTTFRFIADLMEVLANRNKKLDVLMTKSGDTFGYDLILQCDGVTKYVQLKTTQYTKKWEVHNTLVANPEGALIVIYIHFPTPNSWNLEYRIWDTQKLPSITQGLAKSKILETMLEPSRNIQGLGTYMFP